MNGELFECANCNRTGLLDNHARCSYCESDAVISSHTVENRLSRHVKERRMDLINANYYRPSAKKREDLLRERTRGTRAHT